jgi:hypothetical protein|nr:MAG TPA: hypothetical protein [Caudoviricetes sp.]
MNYKADMKSYSDIEKQVNRMLSYMLDTLGNEYNEPTSKYYNPIAAARLERIRRIQHLYTSNINKSEGLYPSPYYVYKSAGKKYMRKVYAGY